MPDLILDKESPETQKKWVCPWKSLRWQEQVGFRDLYGTQEDRMSEGYEDGQVSV